MTIPRYYRQDTDQELRARFTVYIQQVVKYARIMYEREQRHKGKELLLGDQIVEFLGQDCSWRSIAQQNHAFDFEEQRLADAFSRLPLMRQRVLTLLFVEGMPAPEVAQRLNCSVEYVYKQKHYALKKLCLALSGGGDEND